jgi:hypothetical protein
MTSTKGNRDQHSLNLRKFEVAVSFRHFAVQSPVITAIEPKKVHTLVAVENLNALVGSITPTDKNSVSSGW